MMYWRVVRLLAVLCTIFARCDGGGLTSDSRLASAAVSEAYSHSDGDTTLYSCINYLKCSSDHQVTPRSTAEVSDLIKQLICSSNQNGTGRPVKIRATRRGFHSPVGFVCSGERGSSKMEYSGQMETQKRSSESFTMLLHLMNGVVDVDTDRRRMTVEAGMTLLELVRAMETAELSIPAAVLSIYANLTVGGVIMASAHGSGYGTVSSLGDLVRKVKWVNAKGEVIVSDSETEHGAKEVRALVGGLGLLGVATEFTLQMQPNSRTVVEMRQRLKDDNIVADLKRIAERETPHVVALWRPDFGTFSVAMWTPEDKVPLSTKPTFYPKGSVAYFLPFDAKLATEWGEIMRKWEGDDADDSATADALDADACVLAETMHGLAMYRDADGTVIERGTVPTNGAMMSVDCTPKCYFDVHYTGMFTEDTELAIKLSHLEDWVQDVKRIVRTELDNSPDLKSRRCMGPGDFVIRFGPGNHNLLSTGAGGEAVAYVQWTHLHSALIPNKLPKHSSIYETIEQLTLCKYKGRPHWGKNHERIFRHPKCKVRDNFPAENIDQLLAMQEEHDPGRVFEPELFSDLLARKGPEYSALCTAHFWCYCNEDSHCPDGHACRSSTSFPEYKVCKVVDGTYERDVAEL